MRRNLARLFRDEEGAAVVEFALVSPALFLLMFGTLQFGLTMHRSLLVDNVAAAGARTFFVSRGTTTPYTSTRSVMTANANGLTLTITLSIGGTACTTDSGCTALMTSGAQAVVSASSACDLTVMGYDFKPNCTLSSTVTGRIE